MNASQRSQEHPLSHGRNLWDLSRLKSTNLLLGSARGLLLGGAGNHVDHTPRHGLVVQGSTGWHATGAEGARHVAHWTALASHGLAQVAARDAAWQRAKPWLAEIAAQLASLALEHTLWVAVEAWLALLAARHVAALCAACQRAWVGIATTREARALVAAVDAAWAVSELTLQAWATKCATTWRACVATSGAECALGSGMADAAWPLQCGVGDAWKHVVPWLVVEVSSTPTRIRKWSGCNGTGGGGDGGGGGGGGGSGGGSGVFVRHVVCC